MAKRIASLYAEIGADTNPLKRGLQGAKGELSSFKAQAQGTASPLANVQAGLTAIGVAAGVAASAIFAAKRVFDFAKEGAAIEAARLKFDRLSSSIGATSDALMMDLRAATRGMVSDAELVSSAGDLMGLGLAKTHDQVVRLTRVAGALGMNMNQLVLTLTNQTTMRFDALNVSVDGFEERLRSLKATGMSTQDAFTEAFLRQAEQQIGTVGDVADTSAGAFKRLEAASSNLADEWKKDLVDAGKAAAIAIAGVVENEVAAMQAGDLLAEAEKKGVLSGQALYDMRLAILNNTISYTDAVRLLTRELISASSREEEYSQRVYRTKGAIEGNAEAVAFLEQTMRSDAMDEFWKDMAEGGDAAAEAAPKVASIAELMSGNLASPMKAFIEDLKWFQAGGWRIEAAFEAVKKGLAEGKITPAEADAYTQALLLATTDLQVELDGLNVNTAAKDISGSMDKTRAEIVEYIRGTDGIQGALDAITGTEWEINVKINYTGSLPPGLDLPPMPGQPPTVNAPRTGGGSPTNPGNPENTPQSVTPFDMAGGGVYIDGIYIDGAGDPEAVASAVVAAIYDNVTTAGRAGAAYTGV